MPTSGKNSSWEHIQNGVNEAERLITKRDYNSSMVKSRQTLEFMVKQLALRAHIDDSQDLKTTIDDLYRSRWISKTTFEHYHAIRMIGNKAVHEDYNNALDANQAYHMLSQEVYTFSDNYSNAMKGSRSKKSTGTASRSRRRHEPEKKQGINPAFLVKILIPVLCVILLIIIIRLFMPHADKPAEQTQAVTAAEQNTEAAATMPETTAAPATYKTTSVLNVRSAPTTDSMILGKLSSGAAVEYVDAYDSDWAHIRYNGSDAYVASKYLTTE